MKPRKYGLSLVEQRMDFAGWVADELTVYERAGSEWTCDCPKCGSEKLAVNVAVKAYQCWHCGYGGWSPVRLLMAHYDTTAYRARQVIDQYASQMHRLSPRVGGLDPGVGWQRQPIPAAPLPPGLSPLQGVEAAYAHHRGIPSDHAYWFGLSSIHGDNRTTLAGWMLQSRLLIPVWGLDGKLVHWVARATDGDGVKTVNLPDACNGSTHKKGPPCRGTADCTCKHERWGLSPTPHVAGSGEALVGLNLVQPGQRIVVVEGPIDTAVCGPGFVGTMGAKLSLAQAALIVASGASSVVLLFDSDEPGEKGARKALTILSPIIPTTVARCPDGIDPALLGRRHALSLADRAGTTVSLAGLSPAGRGGLSLYSKKDNGIRRMPHPVVEKLS